MPKRNGHNPIRANKTGKQGLGQFGSSAGQTYKSSGVIHCPKCNGEIPPKPGFRTSSLKCPKCSSS